MRVRDIRRVGLIDADDNNCIISLFAVQTPNPKTLNTAKWTLVDWYLYAPERKVDTLLSLTNYVVADAWFAKRSFCEGITGMGFHLISRFRDDARLMYPKHEPRIK